MDMLSRTILVVLSAIFLVAGVDKALHYEGFVRALSEYVLVPRGTSRYLAAPVIVLETWTGIALWVRQWRRVSLLLALGLLVAFTSALSVNHLLGGRGICGCWFTFTLGESNFLHIVQNLVLAAMAGVVWWESRRRDHASNLPTASGGVEHRTLDQQTRRTL